jgi:hypothetical protein
MSEVDARPDEIWRAMSSEEAAVIRSILSHGEVRFTRPLIADLDGALVANETRWILDVKVTKNDEGTDLSNGPFPAHAFVPNSAEYQGEVIIRITGGHLSGLEYAWVSDDPPARWPRADEMEVVLQANSRVVEKDAGGQRLQFSRHRSGRPPQGDPGSSQLISVPADSASHLRIMLGRRGNHVGHQ